MSSITNSKIFNILYKISAVIIVGGLLFLLIIFFSTRPIPSEMYIMVKGDHGYEYPHVTLQDRKIQNKINQELDKELKYLGCDDKDPRGVDDWNVDVTVEYTKNDIFSVRVGGVYQCDSMVSIEEFQDVITFDTMTGERVRFEDLFANYKADRDAIITLIYGDPEKDKVFLEDSCAELYEFENLYDLHHAYSLSTTTPGSITITPEFRHYNAYCVEPVKIKVEKLAPFLKKSSILERV